MKEFLRRTIFPFAAYLFFARPGNRKSFDGLGENLRASGDKIKERILAVDAEDSHKSSQANEKAFKILRHIIAIERWGQKRLMVFLGEPFVMDENYPYLPEETLGWLELNETFAETRAKTVEITRSLSTKKDIESQTVKHNDFGEISAKAWLQYLTMHANNESKGIK